MARYIYATKSTVDCNQVYARIHQVRERLKTGDSLRQASLRINCCASCVDQALWRTIGMRSQS